MLFEILNVIVGRGESLRLQCPTQRKVGCATIVAHVPAKVDMYVAFLHFLSDLRVSVEELVFSQSDERTSVDGTFHFPAEVYFGQVLILRLKQVCLDVKIFGEYLRCSFASNSTTAATASENE